MPGAEHKQGLRVMRKAVPAQRLSTAQRSMGPADDNRRSKLDKVRSREPLFHGISQDYLTKEAPQHFACEAEVFLRDK
jgi:hypothetical protein